MEDNNISWKAGLRIRTTVSIHVSTEHKVYGGMAKMDFNIISIYNIYIYTVHCLFLC